MMSEKPEPHQDCWSREEVSKFLEPLKPVFARAATGDFSGDVDALEGAEDVYEGGVFADVYEGVQIMLEVIRDTIRELGDANIHLEQYAKDLERAHFSLHEVASRDEAILEGVGEGLVVTNQGGTIVLANDAALQILRCKREELIGHTWEEVLILEHEDGTEVEGDDRLFARVVQENKTIRTGIEQGLYYRTHDGGRVPVALTVTPIMYESLGVVDVFRDISREKEIDREKSEFISIASHQLRTPLSSIGWHAEMLARREVGPLNAKQAEYLIKIERAKQRMAGVVRNLLDVSRMEMGTYQSRITEIDIGHEVKSVIEELQPLSESRRVEVTSLVGPDLPVIHADRNAARAVLQNILTNAIKYTLEEGAVRVVAEKEKDGTIRINIADTGVGIPKAEQSKIFTRFFRAENVKEFDTSGTGLGLYAVKQFAEMMGGSVEFISEEGKGTTFTVRFPVDPPVSTRRTVPEEGKMETR